MLLITWRIVSEKLDPYWRDDSEKRHLSFRISEDNPSAAGGFSGSVVKRCLPELHHFLEFVAMHDD